MICHLSHCCVQEAVAGGWLHFEHIPGTENPADILAEPVLWCALKAHVEPLLVWKGDVVDAPPGGPNPEGSDKDLGHGASQVVDQSHMVMMNHGCDLTGDALGNESFENPSASMPIPAMLPDNHCGVLCKEGDQC